MLRLAPLLLALSLGSPLAAARLQNPVNPEPATHPLWSWIRFRLDTSLDLEQAQSGPNPWLDLRLDARFTHVASGTTYWVPGHYIGDSEHLGSGGAFQVSFTPDRLGAWDLQARLWQGAEANLALPGTSTAGLQSVPIQQGANRRFRVVPQPSDAPGFRAHGRLEYIGLDTLRFAGSGEFWLKGGMNSPENLFGFLGFDDVLSGLSFNHLRDYPGHVNDWQTGDPDWIANGTGVSSRGLAGALRYLAQHGCNSVYFLTNNLRGDGNDTAGFIRTPGGQVASRLHYDASRMHQWSRMVEHMDDVGLAASIVFAEQELLNWTYLDDEDSEPGSLGVVRRLFFKQMVAYLAPKLALKWHLCEEQDADGVLDYPGQIGAVFTIEQIDEMGRFLRDLDPYDHPITIMPQNGRWQLYANLIDYARGQGTWGPQHWLDATSIMKTANNYGTNWDPPDERGLENMIEDVRAAFRPPGAYQRNVPIDMDEIWHGHALEPGTPQDHNAWRKGNLYKVYFHRGQLEWYVGRVGFDHQDVQLEDFSLVDDILADTAFARNLIQAQENWWRMIPAAEALVGETDHSFYAEGTALRSPDYRTWLVYWPDASATGSLDLSSLEPDTPLELRWVRPRAPYGQVGLPQSLVGGGGMLDLPAAPNPADEDWVAHIAATR